MMTEKMRVSASSVIRSVAEIIATPARCRREAEAAVMRESVPSGLLMGRSSILIRRCFAVASVAWAAAIPGAALLAAAPAPRAASYLGAAAFYAVGSVVCHQLPARSFFLWGRQLPVCARCTGIYAGSAAAALVFFGGRTVWRFFARLKPSRSGIARLKPSRSGIARLKPSRSTCAAAAFMPTAATLAFEWTTGVVPPNAVRAAAGVVLGATLAVLVLAGPPSSDEVN
jgi:hypothetical protein